MFRRTVTVSLVLLVGLAIQQANGAAFRVVDDVTKSIEMSGPIVPGDAEKLAGFLARLPPLTEEVQNGKGVIILPAFYLDPSALVVDSPGGSVKEALLIGTLVKELGIDVRVKPKTGVCVSSCFLIYISAIERSASGVDRYLAGEDGLMGRLGIHRPYFPNPEPGPQGARRQETLMTEMREYLVRSSVPQGLIDVMMSHPSSRVYWLNQRDVDSIGEYSPGVEEQLIANCSFDSKAESGMSAREYIRSTESGIHKCITKYMRQAYAPLRDSGMTKLRQGWRPW